ncbi:MAG: hypothetical protein E7055_09205 [Lentisphaerae bacterium]|nr:hypothetical protein [Lentisphaerota bacterium]
MGRCFTCGRTWTRNNGFHFSPYFGRNSANQNGDSGNEQGNRQDSWKTGLTLICLKIQIDFYDENNTSRDVYADSAYRSAESEANLKDGRFRAHLQRKGCKGHPLTSWEKQGNRTRAKTRSRIEHIFGAMT